MFLNLSKAIDTVDIYVILHKGKLFKLGGPKPEFLNYLSNRKQAEQSKLRQCGGGVSQGYVLGPNFFPTF